MVKFTPLYSACTAGHTEIVKLLLGYDHDNNNNNREANNGANNGRSIDVR